MAANRELIDQRLVLLRRGWKYPPPTAASSELSPHAVRRSEVPPLTVAINRQAGAPGAEVARELGDRLGWPVYDREILDLIAEEANLRAELFSSLDERDPGWLMESLTHFGDPEATNASSYLRHLLRVLLALGKKGRAIIVGRGASAVLNPETTLRVRIIGRLEDRVRRYAQLQGITEREARREVRKLDRKRAGFVSKRFHVNVNDPLESDLTLNASRLTVDECCRIVAEAMVAQEDQMASAAEASDEAAAV